jgi:hypothetical protein
MSKPAISASFDGGYFDQLLAIKTVRSEQEFSNKKT